MKELEQLRKKIDYIDQQLLRTLAKRFRVVAKIGKVKKSLGLPLLDKKRWEIVLQSRIQAGKKFHLPEKLIKIIYEAIHKHSLKIEEEIKK